MLNETKVTRGMVNDIKFFKNVATRKANNFLALYEYSAMIVMAIFVMITVPFGIKNIFTTLIDNYGLGGASAVFIGACTSGVAITCLLMLFAARKYKKYFEMAEGFSKKYHQYLDNYWSQSVEGEEGPN